MGKKITAIIIYIYYYIIYNNYYIINVLNYVFANELIQSDLCGYCSCQTD